MGDILVAMSDFHIIYSKVVFMSYKDRLAY